jgi:uncharacterized membrane protein
MTGEYKMQMIYIIIAGAAALVIFLVALFSLLKSDFKKDIDKVIWLLTILFVPLFGPIFYFIISPEQKSDL